MVVILSLEVNVNNLGHIEVVCKVFVIFLVQWVCELVDGQLVI